MIAQFLKFCVVGAVGVSVDFAVTYLLKEYLRINKYIANSIGFMCAASSNFLLNRIWTFESHSPEIALQYLLFLAISLGGLLLNNGIIYLISDYLKLDLFRYRGVRILSAPFAKRLSEEQTNFYTIKLIATGLVTLWNFFMNYFITFTAI